jgi:hypothetical protein
MSFLSGLSDGMTFLSSSASDSSFMSPKIIVALAVTLLVLIGIGMAKAIPAGKAWSKANHPPAEPLYEVAKECRMHGHSYGEYDTGWRCATCGNHVAKQPGELYGLVEDGRHERRRHAR